MRARHSIVIAVGCAVGCTDDPELSARERTVLADGLASLDGDATVIDAVERTFSGDLTYAPGDPVEAAVHAAAASAGEAASGRLGSCLGSVQSAFDPAAPSFPVVTHTLTGCGGLDGTVTSRWFVVDGLAVSHQTTGLAIDGRATTVTLGLEIYLAGDLETRRRTLSVVTSNAAGEPVSIDGSWVATYDLATGCGTRDGTVSATIDRRSVRRRDRGLAFCSESLATPTAGTLELAPGGSPEPLQVRFLGDDRLEILRPDGARFETTVGELRD